MAICYLIKKLLIDHQYRTVMILRLKGAFFVKEVKIKGQGEEAKGEQVQYFAIITTAAAVVLAHKINWIFWHYM